MKVNKFLAFDLGASSGRAMLGFLGSGRLRIEEIHRFPNRMIEKNGHLHWNLGRLVREVKTGIRKCLHDRRVTPDSIGIDAWGVDFGLLDAKGRLIAPPFCYRDPQTRGMIGRLSSRISKRTIYRITGSQFLEINSLFQLAAIKKNHPGWIEKARRLLFMPDLLAYLLTGAASCEYTIASTSQLMDCRRKRWSGPIFEALGVPSSIMTGIVQPGFIAARLKEEVARDLKAPRLAVATVAGHDTASAVCSVPASGKEWAYISSGTWSLMGVETERPVVSRLALKYNFTNEGGVGGRIRLLKNIPGLWLLQECLRSWSSRRSVTYSGLLRSCAAAGPARSFIDPDHPGFVRPKDMPAQIRGYYRRTGQDVLARPAEIARSILESLALKYRLTLEQLLEIRPGRIKAIHVVGGGSRNRLLCQFTADATGRRVVAGPAEASAVGNILCQAMASDAVADLSRARDIVRRSFPLSVYEPLGRGDGWSGKYKIFLDIIGK